MFQENITKKIVSGEYTGQEALFEIVVIVSTSVVLGWVLRWLWDLFFKDKNFFSIFLERLVEKIKLIKRGSSKKYNFFIKKEIKERFEKSSPRAKKQKDNLRIIEGVGPKIESLLEREQIASFKQLSQTNMEQLKDILKKAGDRYAFHNPATWPEQALLAHEHKWDELEEFQDYLKGGNSL